MLTPRTPSPLAPGLTRTALADYVATFRDLALQEPPPAPAPKADVPENVVWQFWWQGEERMPAVVRTCLESVRRHVAPRPVRFIHEGNYGEYVDLPSVILSRFRSGEMSVTDLSDYLRLALLTQYGGTWIDPTVYMTGPAPEGALDAPFFVFASPLWMRLSPSRLSPRLVGVLRFFSDKPSATLFGSTWWISARRGSYLLRVVRRLWEAHWERGSRPADYLAVYDLFSYAILANARCREEWEAMPRQCTTERQLLLHLLLEPYDEDAWASVCALSTVHKLTHKFPRELIPADSFYRHLFKAEVV